MISISLIILSDIRFHGFVYDGKTGKPIEAAAVYTPSGAGSYTDNTGYYEFTIPDTVGPIKLTASFIGFKESHRVVNVKPGESYKLDFYLQEEAIPVLKEVVVSAEKEQIKKDIGFSYKTIRKRQLEAMGQVSIQDALKNISSISGQGYEIHIRGSRTNEVLVLVDGIPIRDPISGSAIGTFLPYNAFEELEALTGGFSPEYGEASGGVINIRLGEGRRQFSGGVRYEKGSFGVVVPDTFGQKWGYYPYDYIDLNVSGPMGDKITYFFDISTTLDQTHLPSRTGLKSYVFNAAYPREENYFSGVLKFTYTPSNKWKFRWTYNRSFEVTQGYFYSSSEYRFAYRFPYRYMYHLDGYPTFTKELVNSYFSVDYIPSPSTLLEFRIARVFNSLNVSVNNKHWSQYERLDDLYPPPRDSTDRPGDGYFWDTGDAPYWHDHYSDGWIFKGDFTRYIGAYNKFKTGFIHEYYELQWIDIHYPWYYDPNGLGLNHDLFRAYANKGGFYIQNSTTFSGIIATYGFRLDYWKVGDYAVRAVKRILNSGGYIPQIVRKEYSEFLQDGDFKAYLSPRISFSYPISESQKFFFSYGRFSQTPDFRFVYTKLDQLASTGYELVGNPNLKPIITISYEMGFEQIITAHTVMKMTAFYRDVFNYPTAIRVQNVPPNPDFWIYVNSDYARTVGLEFQLQRNFADGYFYNIDITLSQTKGRSSSPEDAYYGEAEEYYREYYVRWDRPVRAYLSFGKRMWKGIFASFNARIQSGRRYTPMDENGNYGERNSALGPPWFRLDMKLSRSFKYRGLKIKPYMFIRNLFNYKNVYFINPITGREYREGDPIPPRSKPTYFKRPDRYVDPFKLVIGVDIRW